MRNQRGSVEVIIILIVLVILGIAAYLFLTQSPNSNDNESNTNVEEMDSKDAVKYGENANGGANFEDTLIADVLFKDEQHDFTNNPPSYIQHNVENGPWHNSLHIATSTDGVNFTNDKLFVHHAGVPHLFETSDGVLVASFQYFSATDEKLFDAVMYTVSVDGGTTWSAPQRIRLSGFPNGNNPVDPTIVETEDRQFRFYFTFEQHGDGSPQMYTALADTIDYTFAFEGKQLQIDDGVRDPVVVKLGDTWHHYATISGTDPGSTTTFENYHSTSKTGTNFTRQDNVSASLSMLGDVIEDDGQLVFYGAGAGSVQRAISTNGFDWVEAQATNVDGADPGVVKLDNGTYVMIYTYFEQK